MIQGYQDLEVYRRSYRLALEMHRVTQTFPGIERHELGSQVRRAAISIVLNIVEGYGRKDSSAEFKHFLRNALGSCNETRVLIDIVADLGYITREQHSRLSQEYEILGKQIYRLKETWAKKKSDI
ncbi:four helix bundle protein [Desulfofundulus australicus DSM 11792]|uniref:Four helix bundle protein n=1 Tax=Desulfofundulus australicus DSM 11792 TaxID=1121425 RepID=A0A1M5EA37_9FIRM|nr:four helix bundle protein [Desulfofundulus australicus DSM 11792]